MSETENSQDYSAIPEGLTLKQSVGVQSGEVCQLHWSPGGHFLASVTGDNSIEIWDAESWQAYKVLPKVSLLDINLAWSPDEKTLALVSANGILLWSLEANAVSQWPGLEGNTAFTCVAWSPDEKTFATGSDDKTIRLWDVATRQVQRTLIGHIQNPCSLAWSPDGQLLASGSVDGTILLWLLETEEPSSLCQSHNDAITCLQWSPDSELLASGSSDRTVRLWSKTGQQKGILEGHTSTTQAIAFLLDKTQGRLLAAKAHYGVVGLWRADTQQMCRTFREPYPREQYTSLAFHPSAPLLATVDAEGKQVCVWDVALSSMLSSASSSVLYKNAKVIIVGPGGSGKSSLNRVLTSHPFAPETPEQEHHIQLFDRQEVILDDQRKELRETFIWDLDNRSGYRLIHHLYLQGVTVALVILNTLDEGDPFDNAWEWSRALQHIERIKGNIAPGIKKFLVVARADRGVAGITRRKGQALAKELQFDGFCVTRARDGQEGVAELAQAIRDAIVWEELPTVSSTVIFQKIKDFLQEKKSLEQPLYTEGELYEAFVQQCAEYMEQLPKEKWRAQFETCIGLLEGQGVLRRLNFGGYILLQPELLDTYASSLLVAIKDEPDGLGSILESDALQGNFPIPQHKRLKNSGHESALLTSMINDFVLHELALREQIDDDQRQTFLIFPSQSTVVNPDLPETEENFAIFTFVGEVTHVYSPLAVRLSHSRQFRRERLWRNAIEYTSQNDEMCGIALQIKDNLQGEITVFCATETSMETRLNFASYVYWLLRLRTQLVRAYRVLVCPTCKNKFSYQQVHQRMQEGHNTITCSGCDAKVPLPAQPEPFMPAYSPTIQQMDRDAEVQRRQETKMERLQRKKDTGVYDIFFCYNDDSVDKAEVDRIRSRLEAEGYLPWVEAIDIQPGALRIPEVERQIQSIKVAAIFVGKDEGSPPWQQQEIAAILEQAARENYSVMPVLLPHVRDIPQLPPFLRGRVWVDFRRWDPDPLQTLIRGITGRQGEFPEH